MDEDSFKERVERLNELNKVIEKLDPAIRAEAFALLADYVTGEPREAKGKGSAAHSSADAAHHHAEADDHDLFAKHADAKPSENVNLIAAHLYSQCGAQPFKLQEIRDKADEVGITVPASLDMTLKQAKRNGKALYQHTGRSEYKPTVNGELYFKQTYAVKKGTKARPANGNES